MRDHIRGLAFFLNFIQWIFRKWLFSFNLLFALLTKNRAENINEGSVKHGIAGEYSFV